jgi:hypothetical protein
MEGGRIAGVITFTLTVRAAVAGVSWRAWLVAEAVQRGGVA